MGRLVCATISYVQRSPAAGCSKIYFTGGRAEEATVFHDQSARTFRQDQEDRRFIFHRTLIVTTKLSTLYNQGDFRRGGRF
jgi:hypothetical protein